MKNIFLPIIAVAIVSLTACSTNQDLVDLDEVDDIYYQRSVKLKSSTATASVSDEPSTFMSEATEAEQSYYQDMPYVPVVGETQDEKATENNEDDYYDEDYARRLENFHGTEPKEDYIYDNEYGYDTYEEIPNATAPYYNTNPQVNWNMSMGFGNYYGGGLSWGATYGSGIPNTAYQFACYPNPYYYNYYNCGYSSYYAPYAYGGYGGYGGYGYPYGLGYGYGSPYDYGYGNDGRAVVNEQRSSSGRISRGGLILPPNANGDQGGRGMVVAPSSTERWGQTTRAPYQSTARTGQSTRADASERQNDLTRTHKPRSTGFSTANNTRTTKTSRSSISPYTRSQQTRSTDRNPATRRTPSYTNGSRSSNSINPARNNNTRSTPSYSPSRSSGSSSPSRSTSPTRRR